jgi:hypothetical protein
MDGCSRPDTRAFELYKHAFLKAPYVENVRNAGKYDAATLGVPFDGGATFLAPAWGRKQQTERQSGARGPKF